MSSSMNLIVQETDIIMGSNRFSPCVFFHSCSFRLLLRHCRCDRTNAYIFSNRMSFVMPIVLCGTICGGPQKGPQERIGDLEIFYLNVPSTISLSLTLQSQVQSWSFHLIQYNHGDFQITRRSGHAHHCGGVVIAPLRSRSQLFTGARVTD